MPKKGHTEEQIIAALKQYEGGEKVADICLKLGVSQASFYTWEKSITQHRRHERGGVQVEMHRLPPRSSERG